MLYLYLYLYLDRIRLNNSIHRVFSLDRIEADPPIELINFTLCHLVVPHIAYQCAADLISVCFPNGACGGFIQLLIETSSDFLLVDAQISEYVDFEMPKDLWCIGFQFVHHSILVLE